MPVHPKPDATYLHQRMTELGVTPEVNRHVIITERKDDNPLEETVPWFEADEYGNIVINYFNLDGRRYSWKDELSKWPKYFQRIRLKKERENQKYAQAKGSGQYPFFTPGILKKYELAKAGDDAGVITTLVIVEGEFKAFKGNMVGIDIIGIPSIHGFYNGDVRGKLHEDIQELIVKCKVVNIVFLVDADLLSLKWENDKDLAKRPESFFSAVKLFRESLQLLIEHEEIELDNVYFMHLLTKYTNDAKGLDDLLVKYPAVTDEIKHDLEQRQFAKKYFNGRVINDTNKDLSSLRKYMGLSDEQEFYKCYGDFIAEKEFLFRNRRYEYNAEKKEVVYVRHEDASKYMRIGADWVKVVTKLNKYGETEEEIVSWKISEILRDYKKYPGFIEQIQKYDDFCNEPNWNGAYNRSVGGCYNVCDPLKWQPRPGGIRTTLNFLKHIFQGKATVVCDENGRPAQEDGILGDPFTVALDWLTILLKHPKQMLPVPVLVSPENGTGKSTFLKWLQMIFGSNMCILGNAQFQMKFNGHYATKYLISIDEGFLEVDKKAEKERLKQLVTADSIYLEFKGMNVRKIAYYSKLIICSNDADRVMKIEDGESRWFVVKVPVIPKSQRDPDLELKMKAEAEAWLHFLFNRKVYHPREDRLWFDPQHFITDQFKVIVDSTKNRIDRVFEDWIKDQFMTYRLPVLKYSLGYLTEQFNDSRNNKYKIDRLELKAYMKGKPVVHDKRPQRFKFPKGLDLPDDASQRETKVIMEPVEPNTPWIFTMTDWLSPEEIEGLLPLTDPAKLVLHPIGQQHVDMVPVSNDLPF